MKFRNKMLCLLILVTALSGCGRHPLINAVIKGDFTKVSALVKEGADINDKDAVGATALQYAAQNGNIEIVQLLLEKGAEVNVKSLGVTPLMRATQNGQLETARILLKHGADVNAKGPLGMTALMIAAENGNMEIVKLLVEHGVDIGAEINNGATASLFATRGNHPEVEKFLWSTMQAAYEKDKARDREGARAFRSKQALSCPSNLFVLHRREIPPFICVPACPPGTRPSPPGTPYEGARICETKANAVPLFR